MSAKKQKNFLKEAEKCDPPLEEDELEKIWHRNPAPDAEINIMIDFICLVEINTYMRGHP